RSRVTGRACRRPARLFAVGADRHAQHGSRRVDLRHRHSDHLRSRAGRSHRQNGCAHPMARAAQSAVARRPPDASLPRRWGCRASLAIEASSPAYYTLAWNRLRLLIGENKQDEARAELDQILDGRPLPEGVENLMRYHRMKLARDLDEFVRFALRR